MRASTFAIITLAAAAFNGPALAQSATKIGQHNAWGTYSYQAQNGKVCYVLTVPTDKKPTNLDHGDIFFFVSQKPGQNVSFEPQFIAAYNFQEGPRAGDCRQEVVLDVHPRQVGLDGECGGGAAADRRNEDRPGHEGRRQVGPRQPDELRIFAEGHLGRAAIDRQLQVGADFGSRLALCRGGVTLPADL